VECDGFNHDLRRDENDVLREVLQFEMDGWIGRPRNTWKQVEKEMQKAGLKREDALDRTKRKGV